MKRIVTVQDVSCIGKCSLTVALPILSAMGLETAVLPTAVLSTHTAFDGFTFRDLTSDIGGILDHWKKEGFSFDAVYSGYLGSREQIDLVRRTWKEFSGPETLHIVDPAMADNGNLYPGFDAAFVEAMKSLCAKADFVVPNITESCFLTGLEYKANYDKAYIDAHIEALTNLGCKNIVLTGISYRPGKTGIEVVENGVRRYYEHDLQPNSCHGTGDLFAAVFTGAWTQGKTIPEAATLAAKFVEQVIAATPAATPFGVRFEEKLPWLWEHL